MPDRTGHWQKVKKPSEPIFSLTEVKEWLKIEPGQTDDDDLLKSLIWEVQSYIENKTSHMLSKCEIVETFNDFDDELMLSVWPVESVVKVEYRQDSDGALTELASTEYELLSDTFPARIVAAYDKTWPNAVSVGYMAKVTVLAGYGVPENIPDELRMAFRSLIADWHENRENPVRERGTLADKMLAEIYMRWP